MLLGLILMTILLVVFLFQSDGWEGFISLLGLTEKAGFSLDSLASRLEIWPRAIYGIRIDSFYIYLFHILVDASSGLEGSSAR